MAKLIAGGMYAMDGTSSQFETVLEFAFSEVLAKNLVGPSIAFQRKRG
jgi:hypothetical protein